MPTVTVALKGEAGLRDAAGTSQPSDHMWRGEVMGDWGRATGPAIVAAEEVENEIWITFNADTNRFLSSSSFFFFYFFLLLHV